MTPDQRRGATIYASAAVLLLAGGFWWVRAAPEETANPQIAQWEATARELLPDVESQADSGMLTLQAGAEEMVTSEDLIGQHVVSVVCVGEQDSRVRVSFGIPGTDSGRGLSCSGDVTQETFSVTLAGEMRLRVAVNEVGPVVFRYSVLPILNN